MLFCRKSMQRQDLTIVIFLVAVFVMLTQVAQLADTLLYIQLFSTVTKQVNAGT